MGAEVCARQPADEVTELAADAAHQLLDRRIRHTAHALEQNRRRAQHNKSTAEHKHG